MPASFVLTSSTRKKLRSAGDEKNKLLLLSSEKKATTRAAQKTPRISSGTQAKLWYIFCRCAGNRGVFLYGSSSFERFTPAKACLTAKCDKSGASKSFKLWYCTKDKMWLKNWEYSKSEERKAIYKHTVSTDAGKGVSPNVLQKESNLRHCELRVFWEAGARAETRNFVRIWCKSFSRVAAKMKLR